jgi:ribosome-associated protein
MEDPARISKTQRKREMQALQDFGEELVALSAERLAELGLPPLLLDAVLQTKRISKFGALRRQMQYLGRLMREVDAAPIRARLDAWNGVSADENARLHLIEGWRARLVEDERALGELVSAFPHADTQRLSALIRTIRREAEAGKPPRSFRELFRELRRVLSKPA